MNDDSEGTPSTGGVKVRWWQQGSEATKPVPVYESSFTTAESAEVNVQVAAKTPVAVAHPLDIGEVLEEEARRRALAEAAGERVVIYANAAQNTARLKRRLLRFGLPLVALYGVLPFLLHDFAFFGIWLFLVLELAVLYQIMKRAELKRRGPVLTLTDEGIEIHSIAHDMGLVRWDEIDDIRAYTFIYRYVGITPRDTPALARRLPRKATLMMRMNYWSDRFFFRPFRVFTAPINLAQENLPVRADNLVATIRKFRADRGV